MGALTHKKNAFSSRVWEQRAFNETDDTEVSLFRIRVEKLKTQRTRVLPIRYWISDFKRFLPQKDLLINPLMYFKAFRYYTISNSGIKEIKNVQYLVNNVKVYNQILSKLFTHSGTILNLFCSKKLSHANFNNILTVKQNINLYDDLFTENIARKYFSRNDLNNYNATFEEQLKEKKTIILLTNTRLDSPALNSYLFQNSENYQYISFSTFASNFIKFEIPLTNANLIASLSGKVDLLDKVFISSVFSKDLRMKITSTKIITLSPLYLQTNIQYNTFTKNKEIKAINISLSARTKAFSDFFVDSIKHHNSKDIYCNIAIPVYNNIFDHFFIKKINQKFLNRLFLLYFLIKTPKQEIFIRHRFIEQAKGVNNALWLNSNVTLLDKKSMFV